VIELRGDEALAVFVSAAQAVRAALELVAICEEEAAAEGGLPVLVGVGIDSGEAVPVEEGYRGAALNTAARLCSQASAGQVLVTQRVAALAGELTGVSFAITGVVELKGFDAPSLRVAAGRSDDLGRLCSRIGRVLGGWRYARAMGFKTCRLGCSAPLRGGREDRLSTPERQVSGT
jgi:class 3 adenylate cyclase